MSTKNQVSRKVKLAVTPGEPSGIGPDISLKLANRNINADLFVIADPELMQQRAARLKLNVEFNIIDNIEALAPDLTPDTNSNTLNIIPVKLKSPVQPGVLNPDNSRYVLECLQTAVALCEQNHIDALVTGPVHKGVINDAGVAFTGHTEFLAQSSNSKPVMMLATQSLRVALATTHLPLREVSDAISSDSLKYTLGTLNAFLINRCGIPQPKLLVCGLNPHAGEDGHLGTEDRDIIAPVIEACKREGFDILGPLPADTAFTPKYLEHSDAVLAMYHDQGLPVLKYSGFGNAVNITLGLPFIRTSVDHGTALELAGSGQANENSLLAAVDMAMDLSLSKH